MLGFCFGLEHGCQLFHLGKYLIDCALAAPGQVLGVIPAKIAADGLVCLAVQAFPRRKEHPGSGKEGNNQQDGHAGGGSEAGALELRVEGEQPAFGCGIHPRHGEQSRPFLTDFCICQCGSNDRVGDFLR